MMRDSDDDIRAAASNHDRMGSWHWMQSPARNRALRLLVGLSLGAALIVMIAADTAQAASCSGTLGLAVSERGREYPVLSFRCDMPIGGSYGGRLFTVAFANRNATTLKEPMLGKTWLEDYQGQCNELSPAGPDPSRSYVECTALTEYSDPVSVSAGTTITGTPWDAERDMPVCSDTADVTVYGSREEVLATFPLVSTCPPGWKVKQLLTVVVLGSGTVSGNGIWCRGTCTYFWPIGTPVSLSASPDRGATFAGWGDGCAGTAARCSVTLEDDLEVAAVFKGGSTPIGKIRGAIDGPAFVRGTTASATVGCRAPTGSKCTIVTEITTTERLQGAKVIAVGARATNVAKKVVTLAKRAYTIAAGAQKIVSLPLNATGRSLLQRFGKLPVRLTATLTSAPKPTAFYTAVLTFTKR
jgi:Divergent InlB B-repeat domain